MKIKIEVYDDNDELVVKSESLSFEMAEMELGSHERYYAERQEELERIKEEAELEDLEEARALEEEERLGKNDDY